MLFGTHPLQFSKATRIDQGTPCPFNLIKQSVHHCSIRQSTLTPPPPHPSPLVLRLIHPSGQFLTVAQNRSLSEFIMVLRTSATRFCRQRLAGTSTLTDIGGETGDGEGGWVGRWRERNDKCPRLAQAEPGSLLVLFSVFERTSCKNSIKARQVFFFHFSSFLTVYLLFKCRFVA